jgi:hypothetical protein
LLRSRAKRQEPLSQGMEEVGVSLSIVKEPIIVGVSHLCDHVVGPYGFGRALAYSSSRIIRRFGSTNLLSSTLTKSLTKMRVHTLRIVLEVLSL